MVSLFAVVFFYGQQFVKLKSFYDCLKYVYIYILNNFLMHCILFAYSFAHFSTQLSHLSEINKETIMTVCRRIY